MTPLFPSLFEAVVFWGVLVLWVLAFLIWAVRHSGKKGKRRQDLLPLNALAIVVGIASAFKGNRSCLLFPFFPECLTAQIRKASTQRTSTPQKTTASKREGKSG